VASGSQSRDQVRPSDEARQDAADALRTHYSQGRFDEDELERRVGLAYAAATRAELKALFHDLPWDPRSRARADSFWRFQRDVVRANGFAYLGVNGVLVGIWAVTGGGEFWPAWSLVGWGAFLGGHWALVRTAIRSREAGQQRKLPPPNRPRLLN
jgi:hypothetical protein